MSVIDTLIYDRTLEDVEYAKSLKERVMKNGFSSLSASEQSAYLAGLRGCYNISDMNRVGQAVYYLGNALRSLPSALDDYRAEKDVADDPAFALPYSPEDVTVAPKTDWAWQDIPSREQAEAYLNNIRVLRGLGLPLSRSTPTPPASLDRMNWETANSIEKILSNVHDGYTQTSERIRGLIDRAANAQFRLGEAYSGEI